MLERPRPSVPLTDAMARPSFGARRAMIIFMIVDVTEPKPVGPPARACCAPSTQIDPALDAARIAEVAAALAEPIRVQILDVLRRHGEPLCQCELRPLFRVPQPTLSHHLSKLARAGLIRVERRHRWAYYSISSDAFEEITAWLS
jgi:ArsR family transcriptional regulator, arsenate/arsenite/antimonite-responsive transcriptional repressor